ncbi:Laminin gamma 1 [Fasciola gigantica]|uniref:Laminin gamma 1 n=1 Tax=Fasciola gigantica TaxID=46835 RepID=A0A504YHP8_FASGI|nr:Laminin gamma 1 [Fasciola gigantica]
MLNKTTLLGNSKPVGSSLTGECLKCLFGTTGRHCELCLPGYRRNFKQLNETGSPNGTLVPARGCSPCYCEPMGTLANYGSEGIGVCNPETGQCPCKPGVGGQRCEECYPGFYGYHSGQENHYNLKAGCLPCPACYNLVQARVTKLWGMLESVFGPLRPDSKPGSTIGPDDKDLQMEIVKLNNTVVTLYRSVLQIGAKSSVTNPDQLTRTLETFARQVEAIKNDADLIRAQTPLCNSVNIDEIIDRLQKEVGDALPILLTSDVADTIKRLRERISLNDTDKELTETAGDVADLIRKSETLHTEGERLNSRIEGTDELIQKVNNQVYQARTGVSQIPDLRKEVRLLENIMSKWQEANQTADYFISAYPLFEAGLLSNADLLYHPTVTADDPHAYMRTYAHATMNPLWSQLRDVLKERHAQAKQVQQPFIDLGDLAQRVSHAQNVTWHAFIEAQNKLLRIQDFENYVEQTKALVPDAMATKDDLETRLAAIQANVKDLRNQAKQELLRAYELSNRTEDLQEALVNLKTTIASANNRKEVLKDQLDDLRTRHEVDVRPEVNRAAEAADGVDDRAKRVVGMVSATQLEVVQMNNDILDLLKRMKKLKDPLTESANGGSSTPVNGEDAAVRFAKLKIAFEKLHIQARLDKLRELNQSRTIELAYLRHELAEFRAHYKHLVAVNSLLPLNEVNCFYTGKEIEGDVQNIGGR